MNDFFGESLPGCHKMSVCGAVEQGDELVLRIYDNLQRPDANVTVVSHAGDQKRDLHVANLDEPFAYEFVVRDKLVQVQVIEILVDGEPISQSPIRVSVDYIYVIFAWAKRHVVTTFIHCRLVEVVWDDDDIVAPAL
mmetsp:Transcript_127061/g.249002  ORF Transcript_127061/g.249002 Transcript_127061/m.249002 type:complete len:137 (-) Transcript_127061:72-482(-)